MCLCCVAAFTEEAFDPVQFRLIEQLTSETLRVVGIFNEKALAFISLPKTEVCVMPPMVREIEELPHVVEWLGRVQFSDFNCGTVDKFSCLGAALLPSSRADSTGHDCVVSIIGEARCRARRSIAITRNTVANLRGKISAAQTIENVKWNAIDAVGHLAPLLVEAEHIRPGISDIFDDDAGARVVAASGLLATAFGHVSPWTMV